MAVRTWCLLSAALGHRIIEAEITFLFCLQKKKNQEIPVMNIDFVLLLLRQFYVTAVVSKLVRGWLLTYSNHCFVRIPELCTMEVCPSALSLRFVCVSFVYL